MRLVLFLLLPLMAQAESYVAAKNNACKVFKPKPLSFREELIWDGACDAEGYAVGQGILSSMVASGDVYYRLEGMFAEGKLQGVGHFVGSMGEEYRGEFHNNRWHGYGIYYFGRGVNGLAAGNYYAGEFKNGAFHGKGMHKIAPDIYYIGEYKDNMHDGKGIFVSPNYRYTGHWRKQFFHGFGVLALSKGNPQIDGQFANQGSWQDDVYVVNGMFEQGKLLKSCTTEAACFQ